jgi:peptidoglycan/xylan/chitin deacetylase (PgdA/CDA1 family)
VTGRYNVLGILGRMGVGEALREVTPAPLRQAARRARHAGETRLTGSITSVRTAEPVVAFTYDDGPHPERTPAIAAALEARGARGTFFVLVDATEAHRDVVRRLLDGGHEVALHGAEHRNLRHCSLADAHRIIRGGKRRLEAITGAPVKLFRPPFAEQTRRTYAMARAAGMDVVVWSTNTRDCYLGTVDEYVERASKRLQAGAVVLFHDGLAGPDPRVVRPDQEPPPAFDRVELANRMLDATSERGLSVVTVGELLRRGPAKREVWLGP